MTLTIYKMTFNHNIFNCGDDFFIFTLKYLVLFCSFDEYKIFFKLLNVI